MTAIERELGTRYTIDTLRALRRRFPRRQFVWIMGADNLAQFHQWKDWRGIARTVPIAVFARPGYAAKAFASPAMAWLRRYRVPPSRLGEGALPQIAWIAFDPDPTSATAFRRDNPDWAKDYARSRPRDAVTGGLID